MAGHAPGTRLERGLDTSPIHRPAAHTRADRTLVYAPNAPEGAVPVLPGWACSTLVVLPAPASSWTYVLDNRRVPTAESATTVGAEQVPALLPPLPALPVRAADGAALGGGAAGGRRRGDVVAAAGGAAPPPSS